MGKKATHKGKGSYASYKGKGTYATNKKSKLEKHLSKFPKDKQAKQAASAKTFTYKRKKPESKLGWVTNQIKNFNELVSPVTVKIDSVTKQLAVSSAKYLKFLQTSQYQLTPTLEVDAATKESKIVFKHHSKQSNFKE